MSHFSLIFTLVPGDFSFTVVPHAGCHSKAVKLLLCKKIIIHVGGFFLHTCVNGPIPPAFVGEIYAINCSAMFEEAITSFTFQWRDPGGNVINSSDFISISSAQLTSTLQFSPAQQSQGGRYMCLAIVDSLEASNFADIDDAICKQLKSAKK